MVDGTEVQKAVGMANEAGFDVTEVIEVGDLTDVKEERSLLPATKDLKWQLVNASLNANDAKTWVFIKADLVLVDGIEQVDGAVKYKGVHQFPTICVKADPAVYNKEWFQKKQHLVQLRYFLAALGRDLTNTKIDDTFFEEIKGSFLLASVVQQAATTKNASTGKREKTGEIVNEVKNYKACKVEEQI